METTKSKFEPFYLVTKDNKKVVIVAGNNQVSPIEFNSVKDAETYMAKQPFQLMIDVLTIIMYYEKQNELQEKTAKNVAKKA